jgi:hypothetical protein
VIIEQIKQSVYAELLPTLQSAYENNSSVAFGPVKVSQNTGIEANGRQIAWNTVYNVAVKDRHQRRKDLQHARQTDPQHRDVMPVDRD